MLLMWQLLKIIYNFTSFKIYAILERINVFSSHMMEDAVNKDGDTVYYMHDNL